MKGEVKYKPSVPLYVQTLIAMLLGALVGELWGTKASFLGELGKVIITLIKTFATPLLFVAILDAIIRAQFSVRGIYALFGITTVNGLLAITITLLISNIFTPGVALKELFVHLTPSATSLSNDFNWNQALMSFIPESVLSPFVKNTVPAIIVLGILFGLALRAIEKKSPADQKKFFESVRGLSAMVLDVLIIILNWIVYLLPLAVFGVVAKTIGEHGFGAIKGLMVYLVVCLSGMLIQIIFVYQFWIRWVGGIRLSQFWKVAAVPAIYSFGVNSSLATLPYSLAALEKLKVSAASSRLSCCVGTNFNNDGILLYEVMASLFIAQACGIFLGPWQQVVLVLTCILATIGVAGIPEAGVIALTLVLTAAGLPAEALPILLTVDWFIARMRSVTNVVSDLTVAIAIDGCQSRLSAGK